MTPLSRILKHKIVAIIRGADPADILNIAQALYRGGIRVVEITFNSPNAVRAVNQLSTTMGESMLIGMGTVLEVKTVKEAVSAGAKFIISPSLDIEIIRATKQLGAVSIPGAFTATEILSAHNAGADIVKVFPASVGANYIKDLRGPFPHIPLMPTGGITIENMEEYLKTGAVAVGIGGALVDTKQKVTEEYLAQLTGKAAKFVQIVTNL